MPQFPIISRRRERFRKQVEQESLQKALAAVADTVENATLVEKAEMLGVSMTTPAMPGTSWSNQGASSSLITRVTQNLAAQFGHPTPELDAALAEQGMTWGPPFGPGRPLDPFYGYRRPARTFDYQVGENVQITPRWNRVSFKTIKALYEAYDVAQICVRHLINDVRSLDYNWEPIPGITADVSGDIEQAIAFFDAPDKRQPFRAWLAEYLQDVLRYDAGALYIRRNEAGDPIALEVVDGSTIVPLVDFYGRRPQDGDDGETADGVDDSEIVPAFVQVVQGIPWDWLAGDDLIYQPWNPLPDSQYGLAPLEAVLLSANTDIRFQWHFLQFFTEGTVPAGFMEAPPDQSDPNQISHWQEVWDAIMVGDQSKKHQVRWVPNGAKFTPSKPTADSFSETFPLYLMRRTCAAFGVTPNDLGYTENVNRATGDTQVDVQFRVGTSPLLRHAEDVINLFTKEHLGLRCRLRFDDGRDSEDRVATAQAMGIYLDHGVIGVDEVRQELGYTVDPSRPQPRYINNTRSGPIPLIALESMAGKIDPETFGPDASQELVSTPYSSAPGVLPPQGSPEQIASAEHTAQAARDLVKATTGQAPAIAGAPDEPAAEGEAAKADWEIALDWLDRVTKEGAVTAGVTAATGIQGNPLSADEDDDDDKDDVDDAVKTALTIRRWRENAKNRLRKGKSPRLFHDPEIPDDVRNAVWAQLEKAKSRQEVDAAFAGAGKPAAGGRPAFHSQSDDIVKHYRQRIAKAFASLFTAGQIDEAIRAAKAHVAKSVEPTAPSQAARTVLRGVPTSQTQLAAALEELYGDSFLQGAHDAAHAAGATLVASLRGVTELAPDAYWNAWKPGYGAAASRAADGGMRSMLDQAGHTIQGLTDRLIDRIGDTIGTQLDQGASVQTAAAAVRDVIEDPARAEMIANTEMARAMTTASVDQYQASGVDQVQWLAETDACPECEANAADGPFDLADAPQPPAHPNCRCALAPAIEDAQEAQE